MIIVVDIIIQCIIHDHYYSNSYSFIICVSIALNNEVILETNSKVVIGFKSFMWFPMDPHTR